MHEGSMQSPTLTKPAHRQATVHPCHTNLHHVTHEIYAHNSHFGVLWLLALLPETLRLLESKDR